MSAATKLPYYDASKVREKASGRWLEILAYLAYDQLGEAIQKPKKHHTCPIHGTTNKSGKGDGFKFFKDVVDSGGGVCNTCGPFPDGFLLLQEVKGWDFKTTLAHVAEFVGVKSEQEEREAKKASRSTTYKPATSNPQPTTPGQPGDVVPISSQVSQDNISNDPVEAVIDNHIADQGKGEIAAQNAQPEASRFAPTAERMAEIKKLQEQIAKRQVQASAEAQERIDRIWRESIPLNNGIPGPLYKYLQKRAVLLRLEVLLEGDSIRFHRELPYYEEDDDGKVIVVGKFPAMIAAIRDLKGNIITLHRTYLTPRGAKAKVECPRKMMAVPDDKTVTGCAIQLGGFPTDGVMGVAEGYETAASPLRVYGIPTWSCVSASILEQFEPPKGVHTVIGWEDKDLSLRGQVAMQALKVNLEEKGIRFIRMPIRRKIPTGAKSIDWNDVLVKEGIIGMPAYNQLMKVIQGG
jgi:hypothetical protein|tara:strand:- start:11796 stop:13187 length:1392 start_codon:yes stop_codon:yes gene_type:complete